MLFSLVEDTCLIQGIVVDKDFSHSQMPKSVKEMGMGIDDLEHPFYVEVAVNCG
jgi:hypothetical protein